MELAGCKREEEKIAQLQAARGKASLVLPECTFLTRGRGDEEMGGIGVTQPEKALQTRNCGVKSFSS